MFEFAWPWVFLLAPLPWLLRRLLAMCVLADYAPHAPHPTP